MAAPLARRWHAGPPARAGCSLPWRAKGGGWVARASTTCKGVDLEIRCGKCNRLLAKGEAIDLSIKCPRCGAINHVRAASPVRESQRAPNEEPSRAQQDAL